MYLPKSCNSPLFFVTRRMFVASLRFSVYLVPTQVRHIICVKPNDELSARYLDGRGLLRQLSAAGVAAAARAGMSSLPAGKRVDKATFFRDFRAVPGAIQR